jgi:mono/diheme cytochrome c family protein
MVPQALKKVQTKELPQKNPDKEVFMNVQKFICAASLFLLTFTIICAAQEVIIKKVPINPVAAYSGERMYANYCAVCHGNNGKGNGPAAKALGVSPADLTRLAQQNHGKFPGAHVYTVIRGDTNMPAAHGAKDMPVWAALFNQSSGGVQPDVEVHQRISNLTKHVESLQQR